MFAPPTATVTTDSNYQDNPSIIVPESWKTNAIFGAKKESVTQRQTANGERSTKRRKKSSILPINITKDINQKVDCADNDTRHPSTSHQYNQNVKQIQIDERQDPWKEIQIDWATKAESKIIEFENRQRQMSRQNRANHEVQPRKSTSMNQQHHKNTSRQSTRNNRVRIQEENDFLDQKFEQKGNRQNQPTQIFKERNFSLQPQSSNQIQNQLAFQPKQETNQQINSTKVGNSRIRAARQSENVVIRNDLQRKLIQNVKRGDRIQKAYPNKLNQRGQILANHQVRSPSPQSRNLNSNTNSPELIYKTQPHQREQIIPRQYQENDVSQMIKHQHNLNQATLTPNLSPAQKFHKNSFFSNRRAKSIAQTNNKMRKQFVQPSPFQPNNNYYKPTNSVQRNKNQEQEGSIRTNNSSSPLKQNQQNRRATGAAEPGSLASLLNTLLGQGQQTASLNGSNYIRQNQQIQLPQQATDTTQSRNLPQTPKIMTNSHQTQYPSRMVTPRVQRPQKATLGVTSDFNRDLNQIYTHFDLMTDRPSALNMNYPNQNFVIKNQRQTAMRLKSYSPIVEGANTAATDQNRAQGSVFRKQRGSEMGFKPVTSFSRNQREIQNLRQRQTSQLTNVIQRVQQKEFAGQKQTKINLKSQSRNTHQSSHYQGSTSIDNSQYLMPNSQNQPRVQQQKYLNDEISNKNFGQNERNFGSTLQQHTKNSFRNQKGLNMTQISPNNNHNVQQIRHESQNLHPSPHSFRNQANITTTDVSRDSSSQATTRLGDTLIYEEDPWTDPATNQQLTLQITVTRHNNFRLDVYNDQKGVNGVQIHRTLPFRMAQQLVKSVQYNMDLFSKAIYLEHQKVASQPKFSIQIDKSMFNLPQNDSTQIYEPNNQPKSDSNYHLQEPEKVQTNSPQNQTKRRRRVSLVQTAKREKSEMKERESVELNLVRGTVKTSQIDWGETSNSNNSSERSGDSSDSSALYSANILKNNHQATAHFQSPIAASPVLQSSENSPKNTNKVSINQQKIIQLQKKQGIGRAEKKPNLVVEDKRGQDKLEFAQPYNIAIRDQSFEFQTESRLKENSSPQIQEESIKTNPPFGSQKPSMPHPLPQIDLKDSSGRDNQKNQDLGSILSASSLSLNQKLIHGATNTADRNTQLSPLERRAETNLRIRAAIGDRIFQISPQNIHENRENKIQTRLTDYMVQIDRKQDSEAVKKELDRVYLKNPSSHDGKPENANESSVQNTNEQFDISLLNQLAEQSITGGDPLQNRTDRGIKNPQPTNHKSGLDRISKIDKTSSNERTSLGPSHPFQQSSKNQRNQAVSQMTNYQQNVLDGEQKVKYLPGGHKNLNYFEMAYEEKKHGGMVYQPNGRLSPYSGQEPTLKLKEIQANKNVLRPKRPSENVGKMLKTGETFAPTATAHEIQKQANKNKINENQESHKVQNENNSELKQNDSQYDINGPTTNEIVDSDLQLKRQLFDQARITSLPPQSFQNAGIPQNASSSKLLGGTESENELQLYHRNTTNSKDSKINKFDEMFQKELDHDANMARKDAQTSNDDFQRRVQHILRSPSPLFDSELPPNGLQSSSDDGSQQREEAAQQSYSQKQGVPYEEQFKEQRELASMILKAKQFENEQAKATNAASGVVEEQKPDFPLLSEYIESQGSPEHKLSQRVVPPKTSPQIRCEDQNAQDSSKLVGGSLEIGGKSSAHSQQPIQQYQEKQDEQFFQTQLSFAGQETREAKKVVNTLVSVVDSKIGLDRGDLNNLKSANGDTRCVNNKTVKTESRDTRDDSEPVHPTILISR